MKKCFLLINYFFLYFLFLELDLVAFRPVTSWSSSSFWSCACTAGVLGMLHPSS